VTIGTKHTYHQSYYICCPSMRIYSSSFFSLLGLSLLFFISCAISIYFLSRTHADHFFSSSSKPRNSYLISRSISFPSYGAAGKEDLSRHLLYLIFNLNSRETSYLLCFCFLSIFVWTSIRCKKEIFFF